jgi:hypothetical protein
VKPDADNGVGEGTPAIGCCHIGAQRRKFRFGSIVTAFAGQTGVRARPSYCVVSPHCPTTCSAPRSALMHLRPAKRIPAGMKPLVDGLDEFSATRESDPIHRVLGKLIKTAAAVRNVLPRSRLARRLCAPGHRRRLRQPTETDVDVTVRPQQRCRMPDVNTRTGSCHREQPLRRPAPRRY